MSSIKRDSSEYSSSSCSTTMSSMVTTTNKHDGKIDTGNKEGKEQVFARKKLYHLLFSYPIAIVSIFPSVIHGVTPIIVFWLFGKILNEHTKFAQTGEDTLYNIQKLCLYILFLAFITGTCKFLSTFLWVRIGSKFTYDLKVQLFEKMMRNDITFFDTTPIGNILTMLGEDAQLVQDNFGTTKGTQLQDLGQFFLGFILAYVYDWRLALIATCLIPWTFCLIFFTSIFIDRHVNLKFYFVSKAMTIAEETLSSIRTVRGFNVEDIEYERFMTEIDNCVTQDLIIGKLGSTLFSLITCSMWAFIIGNMYYGGTLVEKGELVSGDLMSIFGFMMFSSNGLIELQTSLQAEHKAVSSGARILDMLALEPSIPFTGGIEIDDFKGRIEFRNVSFMYPTRNVYVLKNVSFEIKSGQIGALVGHSGSGKSTCVQLLERYYDVTEGEILLDGYNITTLDPRWLHQQIGLVSQEPTLFQTSIAKNIKYGKRDATFAEIVQAAEIANASHFIEKLNNKYKYKVGEKGSSLSGGQRQRIAIARAILKNPKILVTDEATSALDAGSEKKVQLALDKAMKERTAVIVAHRLTTVRNADIIFVFDAGEICEIGSHDELIEKQGCYFELVKRQLQEDKRNK